MKQASLDHGGRKREAKGTALARVRRQEDMAYVEGTVGFVSKACESEAVLEK